MRITALAIAVLAAAPVQAQIYMCKDASGRTITSDRPIPECADRAMREYGRSGVLKREIAAPLTAEERRQKQLQEQRQKAEAAAVEEQKKSDNAILARYRNEADINTARSRSLEVVDEQVKRETIALAVVERQLVQARAALDAAVQRQAKLQATQQAKQPPESPPKLPVMLVRNVEEAERRVAEGRRRIEEYNAEHARINARFDQTVKRFRELAGTPDAGM